MPITINGTGTITGLSAGAIASNDIASLAATKLTGQVPDANAPSGSVIQVVTLNITSSFSFGSSSFETAYTTSITPLSTNSKLLHLFWSKTEMGNASAQAGQEYQVTRNGSAVWGASWQHYINKNNMGGDYYPPCDFNQWDEPSTTSQVTYNFQGRKYAGNQATWIVGMPNQNTPLGSRGTWVILEIAG
jgi:hypothetical protein